MKYRIYKDGNGYYLLRRKTFLFWSYYNMFNEWGNEYSPELFYDKESIVKFLNEEEKRYKRQKNDKIRILVTEIDANRISPICSNCQKEIEEVLDES